MLITRSARLWPHPLQTQAPYKEIWLLKKHCNTKLQVTKLDPRTHTLETVGLPNGPTTPQWEVECGRQKPWEDCQVGWRKEGRVMDFSRGSSWKGPDSIERPCRKLTSLWTLISQQCAKEKLQPTSTTRALSFGGPSSWEVPQNKPGSDDRQFVRVTECKSVWGPSSGYSRQTMFGI